MRALLAGLLALALWPHSAYARETAAFAVVIGSNRSPSQTISSLRYADDDALANQRVLELLGVHTTVLATPDGDTKVQFPKSQALPPATLANLRNAMLEMRSQVSAAKARGQDTLLYFFFAGHGDQMAGRSFLQLEDAQYWPQDLAGDLRAINADENHVVIDACHAGQFVAARGPGGRRVPLVPGFSKSASEVTWPARTGFLTARSASGQTHEWVEFQAGIFSHQTRSGLLGAADVDLDGRVTYRELAAFIDRANAAIVNPKYRPLVVATPPQDDLDTALISLREAQMQLVIQGQPDARLYVETETGLRWADLHPAPGQQVNLRLPRDLGSLFVMRSRPEAEFRFAPVPGSVRLEEATSSAPRVRARGAAHEAFQMLFALPFARADAHAYVGTHEADAESFAPARSRAKPWAMATIALGTAAALAGAGAMISAHGLSGDAEGLNGVERSALGDQVDRRNQWGGWLIGSGVVTAAAGTFWLWWLNRGEEE